MYQVLAHYGANKDVSNAIWKQYLNKIDRLFWYLACNYVADDGSLRRELHFPRYSCILHNILVNIGTNGHVNLLAWLHHHEIPIIDQLHSLSTGAASSGQVCILQWVKAVLKKLPEPAHLMAAYVTGGYFDDFRNGIEWIEPNFDRIKYRNFLTYVWRAAHRNNTVKAIQWLIVNRYVPPDTLSDTIYETTHISILELLKTHNLLGVKNDNAICAAAAAGRIDIIQWLMQEGFPINYRMVSLYASKRGHFNVIKWLFANGYPPDDVSFGEVIFQCDHKDLSLLEWCLDNGGSLDNYHLMSDAINAAYVDDHVNFRVVSWLLDKGYSIHSDHLKKLISICESGPVLNCPQVINEVARSAQKKRKTE